MSLQIGQADGLRFTLPGRREGGVPNSQSPPGHQALLLALYCFVSTS